MKMATSKSSNSILFFQFFVIIMFLVCSIFFLCFYGYRVFSPIQNIIFASPLEAEPQRVLTKFFQDKSIASLYWKKKMPRLPDFSKIELELLPPVTLKITALKRKPLAYFIQDEQFFAMDEDKFIFSAEAIILEELPQLILEKQNSNHIFQTTRMNKVVSLLKWMEANEHFLYKKISKIFLGDSLNTILIFESYNLPIFLGYDLFEKKVEKLSLVFSKLKGNFAAIKVIDIRYQDKIILEHKE